VEVIEMDYRLEAFIQEHLPNEKKEISRDMAVLLLKLVWEKAKKSNTADRAEQDREDRYGPMFY